MARNKNICEKTLSGEHYFTEKVREVKIGERFDINGYPVPIYARKCFACGLLDDTKEKNG